MAPDSKPRKDAGQHPAHPHSPALVKRLNRIEGQIRGIARMVEDDRYCVDILTQLSAVRAALDAAALELIDHHARGCVQSAVHAGNGEAAIGELTSVLRKYYR
jgi:DNA-binding FrmR family transcriptional regulator